MAGTDLSYFDDLLFRYAFRKDIRHVALEFFRLVKGCLQADSDILRDQASAHWDDLGMADASLDVGGNIGGATADVHQNGSQLLFIFGQDSFRRGKLLHDHSVNDDTCLIYCVNNILDDSRRVQDQMEINRKVSSGHTDRIDDAVVAV